jgi:hypothetical protein
MTRKVSTVLSFSFDCTEPSARRKPTFSSTLVNHSFDFTKMSSPQRFYNEPSLSQHRTLAETTTSPRATSWIIRAHQQIPKRAPLNPLKRCIINTPLSSPCHIFFFLLFLVARRHHHLQQNLWKLNILLTTFSSRTNDLIRMITSFHVKKKIWNKFVSFGKNVYLWKRKMKCCISNANFRNVKYNNKSNDNYDSWKDMSFI